MKTTHGDDTLAFGTACCDSFVHLSNQCLNLNHVVRCVWEKDGTATAHITGPSAVVLEGDDRDLLAEALGLPSADEMTLNKKGAKDRLEAAQETRLDAAKEKADALAKAKEAKAKAAAHEAEVAAKAQAKEKAEAHHETHPAKGHK